jgi:type VI secretion system (T6SS) baseplate-like injector VgrG
VTSALFDSISRIARHEAAARAVAGAGRVTEIRAGDRQDHAVTVEMRDTGLVLPNVPVAVGLMGFAAIPAVDDLVVIAFLEGDVNAPVVVGRLYDADQAPPGHKSGEIVLHVPSGDPKLEIDVKPATPSIRLAMGKVTIEVVDDALTITVGDTEIKAESSGARLEIAVGGASLVMKKDGSVTLDTDGKLKIHATEIDISADARLKLAGATVEIN